MVYQYSTNYSSVYFGGNEDSEELFIHFIFDAII